jgi:DNA repair exonuclease SbcCD nuclease subunit
MKVVCSSDWHADWVSHGVRRFDEVAAAARHTVAYAIREHAGLYVCCGDLCDPDNGPGTIRAIGLAIECAMALSANGVTSAWVAGNHDVFEDGTGESVLGPLASLGLDEVMVFERPHAVVVNNTSSGPFSILGLPYPPITSGYDPNALDFEKLLHEAGHAVGSPIIVASHMTRLPGTPLGEESGEMARGRDVAYPAAKVSALRALAGPNRVLALQGHLHHRMSIDLGEVVLQIPGSVARLTFGEEMHRPRFILAEI